MVWMFFMVLAAYLGYGIGSNLAESPAQAKARVAAHDKAVVQATEASIIQEGVYLSQELSEAD